MMFFVHLLFEEKCEMPQQSVMNEIMEKHLGKTECFSYDISSAGFIPENYMRILKTLMLIHENMRRESGNKLFTQIPYYKKQFTFIG